MKLAIIHTPSESFFTARLIKIITNKSIYRCGFVDENDGTFFDMCWKPQKSDFLKHIDPKNVELYDVPILTRADCEVFLKQDRENVGGLNDYVKFIFQYTYYLLNRSLKNNNIVYTEKCSQWFRRKGYMPPINKTPVCEDLIKWARTALQKTARA